MSDVVTSVERAEAARRRGWFTRRPLRTRLAILTAAAVAIAVVLCAGASWVFARQQMISQVDDTLKQSSLVNPTDPHFSGQLTEWCNGGGSPFHQGKTSPTLVLSDTSQLCAGGSRSVKLTGSDYAIAGSGATPPDSTWHIRNGVAEDGTPVRVYTVSIGPIELTTATGTRMQVNAAVAFSQSLLPVNRALAGLALILVAVSLVVILGAVLVALFVARAALKPVDRLTDAVEYIARTEDLGTTIPVEGADEIARLSTSFNSMSTALASSRERQSQLIADAGHELRTPLTSLRTNVDLLVRSEETGRSLPPDTRSKLLRNLKAQMAELSTLIGDLLELSRPSRPKGSAPPQVVAWHDLVARALDRARLRGPGITFHVEINPWFVRADAHALERAVINLLDNAVKFSPPDGTVDVRLRAGRLTVRDRGPGIPQEDIPHVFERFWRSPSARQLPGSGLGLAIVAQTVRESGGEVAMANADPRPDGSSGGALATIVLPGAPTPPPSENPDALVGGAS